MNFLYVKVFESYRLTYRQTNITKTITHATLRVAKDDDDDDDDDDSVLVKLSRAIACSVISVLIISIMVMFICC